MADRTVDMEVFLRALLVADEDRRRAALRVLHGDAIVQSAERGPLLLSMGAAAQLLGVSRPTLWRMIQAGRLEKVEVLPGSYRIRRSDLEALAEGRVTQ